MKDAYVHIKNIDLYLQQSWVQHTQRQGSAAECQPHVSPKDFFKIFENSLKSKPDPHMTIPIF